MILSACANTTEVPDVSSESAPSESVSSDTRAPSIRIMTPDVYINVGEEYDLLTDVTGRDNVDGDITDKIVIDKGGYDPNVAGVYVLTYTLTDSSGNEAKPKTRTITVKETKVMERPEIFTDKINGEKKPTDPKVFGGAWYHKVVSSRDAWLGIETVVTLPEFEIERYDGEYNTELAADPNAKNLDNPSVYLGGNARSESDVGLSLSKALVDVNAQKLSKGSIAFRPFWRYITSVEQDVGGYDEHGGEYAVSANGNNCMGNYHWRYTEYYYLPGDKLRIIVFSPAPNKLQLQIEVIEKSTLPSSVETRKKYGWKDPANFVSPIFHSPGQGVSIDAEFKRVNAIDQSANEGKTAIPTDTIVKNMIYHETYLYREINGKLMSVPMTPDRMGVCNAPYDDNFTITYDGVDASLGGEVVVIHPGYKNSDN